MREITLDGIWDFFYSPQEFEAEKNTLPEIKEYCGKMLIPGYWDDHYELFDEEDFYVEEDMLTGKEDQKEKDV